MFKSIYSNNYNNIVNRIKKFNNDFTKINRTIPKEIVKLKPTVMDLGYREFILPYQYKENYITFDLEFSDSDINFIPALFKYAVLLRYVHNELATPENVLLKLWSVMCNLKLKHSNIPSIICCTVDDVSKYCVELSFSDTVENLISLYNIDIEYIRNNFIQKNPRYYINPKLQEYSDSKKKIKSKEYTTLLNKAQTAWLLYAAKNYPSKLDAVWSSASEYTNAVNLYNSFKKNNIKLEDFINILEVYNPNMSDTFIINNLEGCNRNKLNRFKTVYNDIFGENIKRQYTKKNNSISKSESNIESLEVLSGNNENNKIKNKKISPKNIKFNISNDEDLFTNDDLDLPEFSVNLNEPLSQNKQLKSLSV